MSAAIVHFVGAGSGAPDLITVRGMRLLQEAKVIVYAGSLVNPQLLQYAPKDCEIHDSAYLHLDQVIDILSRSAKRGTEYRAPAYRADPSIYGAVSRADQIGWSVRHRQRRVSGSQQFSGRGGQSKAEYTLPGVSQTVILTRLEGRTPVPDRENLRSLAPMAHRWRYF